MAGYADGEFVTIKYDSNAFNDVVGTDGEVSRSRSNDRRATVEVKLMQTSDSNDLLAALAVTDRTLSNGAGIGALMIRDQQGRAVYTASECWIMKEPDISVDRTPTERVWQIRVANLISFTGGN